MWRHWSVALAGAFLYLLSILVHELAHALLAQRHGLQVRSITLFLFGGAAYLDREPETPRSECLIALIGPLTSLVLGSGMLIVLLARVNGAEGGGSVIDRLDALSTLLLWLGPVNMLLGLFNLIPAFPMDGGRVLRALLWGWRRDLIRATRWASWISQSIAAAFVVGGLAMTFGIHLPIFGSGVLSGVWLAVMGVVLGYTANLAVAAPAAATPSGTRPTATPLPVPVPVPAPAAGED